MKARTIRRAAERATSTLASTASIPFNQKFRSSHPHPRPVTATAPSNFYPPKTPLASKRLNSLCSMKESSFTAMVESYWLANAHSAFTTPLNPDTGEMRYCTTHTRAFHKSLGDLLKLRSERRKANIGFEAQKHQTERHEMAKITHQIELFAKDMKAQRNLTDLVLATTQASRDIPGFKTGLDKESWQPKTQAA